jgi:hypothetical protein
VKKGILLGYDRFYTLLKEFKSFGGGSREFPGIRRVMNLLTPVIPIFAAFPANGV